AVLDIYDAAFPLVHERHAPVEQHVDLVHFRVHLPIGPVLAVLDNRDELLAAERAELASDEPRPEGIIDRERLDGCVFANAKISRVKVHRHRRLPICPIEDTTILLRYRIRYLTSSRTKEGER